METLSYQMFSHKAVVERTKAVLEALNEHAQELRDLQSQEEVRLQSVQTSLIAAIASLIGVGQLSASVHGMSDWDTELRVWFLILAGIGTFALSYVAFNLRRANTWVDYLCSGLAFGAAFLTLYLWSGRYSAWSAIIQLLIPHNIKIYLFALGFVVGLGIAWLLGWLSAWRSRREVV